MYLNTKGNETTVNDTNEQNTATYNMHLYSATATFDRGDLVRLTTACYDTLLHGSLVMEPHFYR